MKNFSKVLGIIAVAIIGFSMVSCSMIGGDKGGGFSAPGAKGFKAIPNFEGTFVGDEAEALALFTAVLTDFAGILDAGYEEAFKAANGKYEHELQDTSKPSYSYSVKINDTTKLKEKTGVDSTIKGSVTASASTNATSLNAYLYLTEKDGYTYQSSDSTKLTYEVKGLSDRVAGYKVAGIVTVDGKNSDKKQIKTAETTTVSKKWTENTKGTLKVTIALSVSNGTKGAKFRYSYATTSTGAERKSTSKFQTVDSNLEVADNSNKAIYTIQDIYVSLPF